MSQANPIGSTGHDLNLEFVQLERRFSRELPREDEDPELWIALQRYRARDALSWHDLEQDARVVVLAEAGSGKSREMREEARRLREGGHYAAYIRLEELASQPLEDLLDGESASGLPAWRDGTHRGHIFLDAVDELKLKGDSFESALRRAARFIHGREHRCRIVISSRPSDWRRTSDLQLLSRHLPTPPAQRSDAREETGKEYFERIWADQMKPSDDQGTSQQPRVVSLLPLTPEQVERYAECLGVIDRASFMRELQQERAWPFAQRPLDVQYLVRRWNHDRRFGSRVEQLESDIDARLRETPGRIDTDTLSPSRAREGVERLALALVLTRSLGVGLHADPIDGNPGTDALRTEIILHDWSTQDRARLLRRGIFDPATFGRVRFHHRSVTEYLAARRLQHLREAHTFSASELCGIFFGECYGFSVAFPTRRRVVAWLALWDHEARRKTLDVDPTILLEDGDPGSLELRHRIDALRATVQRLRTGEDFGMRYGHDALRRLADQSGVASAVRELWSEAAESEPVRELLLELIRIGGLVDCHDIAFEVALDPLAIEPHRETASKAILECAGSPHLERLHASLVAGGTPWPDPLIRDLIPAMSPERFTANELVQILRRTPERSNTTRSLQYGLQRFIEACDPDSSTAAELRLALTALVLEGRSDQSTLWALGTRYRHCIAALALACQRALNAGAPFDPALARAAAVACFFRSDRDYDATEQTKELRERLRREPELRAPAFWAGVALARELKDTTDDYDIVNATSYHIADHKLDWSLDSPWLLDELKRSTVPSIRHAAVHTLVSFAGMSGRSLEEQQAIAAAIGQDVALGALFERLVTPPDPEALAGLHATQAENRRRAEVKRAAIQDAQRQRRARLLEAPALMFEIPERVETLEWLWLWSAKGFGRHDHVPWREDALRTAFSADAINHCRIALKRHWREADWGSPSAAGTATARDLRLAFWALKMESSTPNWPELLSHDEALSAARVACFGSNSLPGYTEALARHHPEAVRAALGAELLAQLGQPHAMLIQHLGRAPLIVQRCVTGEAREAVDRLRLEAHEPTTDAAKQLNELLQLLANTLPDSAAATLAQTCSTEFERAPLDARALARIAFGLRVSALAASEALLRVASSSDASVRNATALCIRRLFFDSARNDPKLESPLEQARAHANLVRAAFRCVPEEASDTLPAMKLDEAKRARSRLFSALFVLPGREAVAEGSRLRDEPSLVAWRPRVDALVEYRAAVDAEPPAATAEDVRLFEKELLLPPSDSRSLFAAVKRSLDQIQNEITDGELSDRATLSRIDVEVEMQNIVAKRMRASARATYHVEREVPVADEKKPDVLIRCGTQPASMAIEIKLADSSWTLADLEVALRNQLVGQYLRDEHCRAGLLLLTYAGRKQRWRATDGVGELSFEQLLEHLQSTARDLCAARPDLTAVEVLALDLRPRPLAAAHRRVARAARPPDQT